MAEEWYWDKLDLQSYLDESMGEEAATRPVRDIDYYDENVEELLKEYKYLYKDEAKYDLTQVLHQYQNLHPKIERCAHTKGGRTEELVTLRGTIPIVFKEATYNIPIQIYTLRTHPKQPPIVFVKPSRNMVVRTSKYVDQSGLVYLRYLVQWKSPRSNVLALCKLLSRTFSEECPVFTEDRLKNTNKKHRKKKKSRRFSTLRRFSISRTPRKDSATDSLVSNDDDSSQANHPDETGEALPTNNTHLLDVKEETNKGANGLLCPSPCDTKSDSSESKTSGKNVSFAHGHNITLDEIPDDILDESLDSIYSSSFESLYSDRSVTILQALRNQNIDTNSVFNSSFESLLSDRSVSYLLDLERNWSGRRERFGGVSPQPSLDSNRERKEHLLRSLSTSKLEKLRRISRQSSDSNAWPAPPSPPSSPTELETGIKKHDSISSENWPEIPLVLQHNPNDHPWPEPPIDMVIERLATINTTAPDIRDERVLSDVKESPYEDSEESPLHIPITANKQTEANDIHNEALISPYGEIIDRSINKDSAETKTNFNTWEKPDELLLEALREDDLSYLEKLNDDADKTPQNKKKILTPSDKTFHNEIMKLDFTDCEHSSSKESTPRPTADVQVERPMAIEGGMVKRAEPTGNKKRWSFWKKSSSNSTNSNNNTRANHDSSNSSQQTTTTTTKKKQKKTTEKKEKMNGEVEDETHCACPETKPQKQHRRHSVESYLSGMDRNNHKDETHSSNHSLKRQDHIYEGGGSVVANATSNGIYERVHLVNGFSHRDQLSQAKIYEPITFGVAKTRSENSLDCRYKAIGCTVHSENESDSMTHTNTSVNQHMDLLLDKVEFLTHEVQNLKHKLKTLGHDG